jgi:hypothetical protein
MKEKAGEGDWPIENALKAISEARRRLGLEDARKPTPIRDLIASSERSLYPRHNNYTTNQRKSQQKITESVIKTYMEINLAALNAGEEKLIRVWYLARFLDEEGSGVVLAERVEELLACSSRNFQRLLRQGDGKYWRRCKSKRGLVLILIGFVRVSRRLGVFYEKGSRPVLIPLREFVGGVGRLRAALYSSVHALRDGRPISRAVLKSITGIPERTQREYDKIAGVEVRRNFALADTVSLEREKRAFRVWLRGGTKGWGFQLPNSYRVSYPLGCRGMMSNVSLPKRALIDYYHFGRDRRLYFFRSPKKLCRAIQRRHAEGGTYSLYSGMRIVSRVVWWREV